MSWERDLDRTAKRLMRHALAALSPRLIRVVRDNSMGNPTYPSAYAREVSRTVDSVRIAAIGLFVTRIKTDGIEGDLAELGVYRGEISRHLHSLLPDRDLYLFDTFFGFADERSDTRFRDTSIAGVRRTIGGDQIRLRFRQGWFPSTTEGLEEKRFAFVQLDGDRYQTTLDGLKFFYPRLSRGGYVMAHDYNSPESDWGVSRAFDEFLADKPELVVELPDMAGSVVFRKI